MRILNGVHASIQKALAWLFISSANPQKVALTVQGTLVLLVPVIAALSGYDSNLLTGVAQTIAQAIEQFLFLIGTVLAILGLLRKLRSSIGM